MRTDHLGMGSGLRQEEGTRRVQLQLGPYWHDFFAGPFPLHPKLPYFLLWHTLGVDPSTFPAQVGLHPWKLSCSASGPWRPIQFGRSNAGHPWELVRCRFLRLAPPESECVGAGPSDLFLTSSWGDSGAQSGLAVRYQCTAHALC